MCVTNYKPLMGWFTNTVCLVYEWVAGQLLLPNSGLFQVLWFEKSMSFFLPFPKRTDKECLEMLTPHMSFNLSEVRLNFNLCPSPNAGRCARSPAMGRWVVSSWAQVFPLCLGLTLFMPKGPQELQTTEFFIKVTSWRDVPCSCCSRPLCVPTSYIT